MNYRATWTLAALALALVVSTGCQNKKNASARTTTPLANDVLAVEPTFSGEPAPIPSVEPTVASTPVPAASFEPAPSSVGTAKSNYTVKRGDTLYGIARAQYGDGKQWQRIADANPGLTPSTLKAGSTIAIP